MLRHLAKGTSYRHVWHGTSALCGGGRNRGKRDGNQGNEIGDMGIWNVHTCPGQVSFFSEDKS